MAHQKDIDRLEKDIDRLEKELAIQRQEVARLTAELKSNHVKPVVKPNQLDKPFNATRFNVKLNTNHPNINDFKIEGNRITKIIQGYWRMISSENSFAATGRHYFQSKLYASKEGYAGYGIVTHRSKDDQYLEADYNK